MNTIKKLNERLLLVMALIALSSYVLSAADFERCDNLADEVVVEIPIHNNDNNDRSQNNVTALYHVLDREIEVNCFEMGAVSITLYNDLGMPVYTYTFESNSEPIVFLPVPSDNGTYRLVIDSDKYHGEGEFEVRL